MKRNAVTLCKALDKVKRTDPLKWGGLPTLLLVGAAIDGYGMCHKSEAHSHMG
jgi:hypothetical protein